MTFACDVCNANFKTSMSLLDHMQSTHSIHWYACTFCDFKSTNETDMILHQKSKMAHRAIEKICKICGMSFARFTKLVIHVRATQKFGLMDCSLCDVKSIFKCALKVHEKKKHLVHKSKYKCNTCPRILHSRKQAFEHKMENKCDLYNGQQQFYKCIMCDFVGTSNQTLNIHERNKHTKNKQQKKFECDNCGHTFLNKPQLLIHLDSQIKYGNVICLLCDFTAPSKCLLKMHNKNEHTSSAKCKMCTFKASSKKDLTKHKLKNHKPPLNFINEKISSFKTKTYKCKHCDHRASTQDDLISHKTLIHPIPFFQCTICHYSTTVSSKLVEHKEIRHDEFACDLCHFKAARHIDVMIHKEYHHRQQLKL